MIIPPVNTIGALDAMIEDIKTGCLTAYTMQLERSPSIKTFNRNYDSEGNLMPAPIELDGEGHLFKTFSKHEVLKDEIEVIVDLDRIYKDGYTDKREMPPAKAKGSYTLPLLALAMAGYAAYQFRSEIK